MMTDECAVFLRIDTGVSRVTVIRDVNTTNHCPMLAEMKGCQVSRWFVGK